MTADLGPAATPRIPTMEDRMSRPDHIPAPRPAKLRVFNEEDSAAIRSLIDEIDQQRARAEQAERERDSLARRLGVRFQELEQARAERDDYAHSRNHFADLLQATAAALHMPGGAPIDGLPAAAAQWFDAVADLRQQRDQYVANLADAGNEVDLLTAENGRLRQQLGRAQETLATLRHLDEQRDRAWAAHDTVSEPEPNSWKHSMCGLIITLPEGQKPTGGWCEICRNDLGSDSWQPVAPPLGSPAPHAQDGDN